MRIKNQMSPSREKEEDRAYCPFYLHVTKAQSQDLMLHVYLLWHDNKGPGFVSEGEPETSHEDKRHANKNNT